MDTWTDIARGVGVGVVVDVGVHTVEHIWNWLTS